MIEQFYTADGASTRLGLSTPHLRSLAQRLGLPRRMDRNPPHGWRRVYTTSDLEAISAYRVQQVTQSANRNPGLRHSQKRVAVG